MVIVWKLDRLARSLTQLITTATLLADRGVELRSVTEQIDTTSPSGKLTFHLFAALAEFERDLIRQRVNAGLKAVRARLGGRKPKLKQSDIEKARALLASGKYSMGKVAQELQVSYTTLWRALGEKNLLRFKMPDKIHCAVQDTGNLYLVPCEAVKNDMFSRSHMTVGG